MNRNWKIQNNTDIALYDFIAASISISNNHILRLFKYEKNQYKINDVVSQQQNAKPPIFSTVLLHYYIGLTASFPGQSA